MLYAPYRLFEPVTSYGGAAVPTFRELPFIGFIAFSSFPVLIFGNAAILRSLKLLCAFRCLFVIFIIDDADGGGGVGSEGNAAGGRPQKFSPDCCFNAFTFRDVPRQMDGLPSDSLLSKVF